MKTYHILIGSCEGLLNDFIEALFQEACRGKAAVKCARAAWVDDFVQRACDAEFDLIIQVPHNLFPELAAPTPLGWLGEGIRAISTIKSKRPTPIITLVALEARARYEPLLLEAGADCVLELPFEGDQLHSAVGRLLKLPARPGHVAPTRWFFAGVLMRGLRRLRQT
jgi:hypothetical protein